MVSGITKKWNENNKMDNNEKIITIMIKKCNNIDSDINSINTTTIRNILTTISNNVNINQGKSIVQLLISFISLYVGYLSMIILTIIEV